jgi:hypothetical protein
LPKTTREWRQLARALTEGFRDGAKG